MTRIAAPADITDLIAKKAVQNARQDFAKRNWKSASALRPYSQPGRVGITTTVQYLMRQNEGIPPFVMWWVKNRRVPLGCPLGDGPHFRFGNPDSVGTAGYVNIPHKGRVFRPIRWRHPGLKPKRFMETAIKAAIKDSRSEIQKGVMNSLRGGS